MERGLSSLAVFVSAFKEVVLLTSAPLRFMDMKVEEEVEHNDANEDDEENEEEEEEEAVDRTVVSPSLSKSSTAGIDNVPLPSSLPPSLEKTASNSLA